MNAPSPQKPIGESQFNMIRCVLAVAHADGEIHEEERAYINKMTSRLDLSNDQCAIIDEDFETPQDVIELFDSIKDPNYKSQVIYFVRLMIWKDGELDPNEEVILKKLQQHASKGSAGFDAIENDVTSIVGSAQNDPLETPKENQSIVAHFFDRLLGR